MYARRLGVVLAFVCWLPGLRAEENRVVHALIVADTVDAKVGRLTERDALIVGYLMKNSIPGNRLSLHVLHGEHATPEEIGRYYENLEVDPRDAIFLFYSGHGAWDPQHGHILTLNAGNVARGDLLRVMTAKRARLTVLVTNCCSSWIRTPAFGRTDEDAESFSGGGFSPAMRCLLFQHQGVVDFTAAKQGTYAFGDLEGGWFTLALAQVLQAPAQQLDLNRDGFVSWEEVFRLVRDRTQVIFNERASPRLRQTQDGQEPICSRLGSRLDGGSGDIPAVVRRAPARRHAGVTIMNPTNATICYQFRWGDEGAVKSFQLPPGCRIRHAHPVQDDQVPTPQICYRCGFQGNAFGDFDSFNLQCREINFADRRDAGKRYAFAVEQDDDGLVVKLTDPDAPRPEPEDSDNPDDSDKDSGE